MCRCQERRAAIAAGASAALAGDSARALAKASFVGRTAAEDMAAALRRGVAAARMRLKAR